MPPAVGACIGLWHSRLVVTGQVAGSSSRHALPCQAAHTCLSPLRLLHVLLALTIHTHWEPANRVPLAVWLQ